MEGCGPQSGTHLAADIERKQATNRNDRVTPELVAHGRGGVGSVDVDHEHDGVQELDGVTDMGASGR